MGAQLVEVRGIGEEARVGLRPRRPHHSRPSCHRLPEKPAAGASLRDRPARVKPATKGESVPEKEHSLAQIGKETMR
jgi:hypothetical protein